MNLQQEDSIVRSPTDHEVIWGPTASGKTYTVRQRLAEETGAEHVETWIVDPHMAVPEFADIAEECARTERKIVLILGLLQGFMNERRKRLAELRVVEFVPGDPLHGYPLIVLTVEDASDLLRDGFYRETLEGIASRAHKVGVVLRLVVQDLSLGSFGGSQVLRSAATAGNVTACNWGRDTGLPIETSISDVIAGTYVENTAVTITGLANNFAWKTSRQGNPWATFNLISPVTAVQAQLFPDQYREFGDGMGPALSDYRPQQLTITGRVSRGWPLGVVPAVVVTDVRRLSDEPCEPLEKMRRMDLRADAIIREKMRDTPQPQAKTGEAVGVENLIALLRGEEQA